ncbi:hydrogen peroxide-inducible genes activator [Acidimangrovimonas pyrenivorans]|uniref:LysR substrate-binding domain-containing protein n=1 Tax=Acidimangrovimonas pyrenivorans TaxID=2030798 RepID=A0ABV7AEB6_9RHOB
MAITLKQLDYFLALAEELNFGRAAERVHISQPALSMQIKELESILEVALVERRPRDVRLTPAGREVLERARRILGEAHELEAAARRRGLSRRLNLGVIPTVAPYLLPVALTRLRAADIGRELRVREAQTAALYDGLATGRLDAIVIADSATRGDLVARPLFSDRFLLAGAAARLAEVGRGRDGHEALRPLALDPEQLLLLDEGHCLADQALEVCGLDRRRPRIDLGASSLTTLCGLVAEGFGLTFLPEIAYRNEAAAAPGMAVMRFARPEPARQITLVRRAATAEDDWFEELAELLSDAGEELVAQACQAVPPGSQG